MEDYLGRIEEAKKRMREEDIDLLLIYGDMWRDGDLRYFTGYTPFGAPYTTYAVPYGPFGMLAISLEEEPTLFTVDFFVPAVTEEIGFIDDWALKEGMTFTFAAGAYEKGVGAAKVEDVCVITKTGAGCLNNFDRALII